MYRIDTVSVSVIIPTYNRAELVREAVRSALDQSRPPDEIIVVDDGSTDHTSEVVATFGPPVIYRRQPHRGVSAARNLGMRTATGDVYIFLDSDDILLPTCIERTIQAILENPDVNVVYSDCLIASDGHTSRPYPHISAQERPSGDILGVLGYRWFFISMSSATVRRCALQNVVFDESLSSGAEDFDFWRQLAARSRFLYLDEPLAIVRESHGGPRLSTVFSIESLDNSIEVQRRIMHMQEFRHAASALRARLYCHHGVKLIERGQCTNARRYFLRSIRTSPRHLVAYALFSISLLGVGPLRLLITKRRQWGDRLNSRRGMAI